MPKNKNSTENANTEIQEPQDSDFPSESEIMVSVDDVSNELIDSMPTPNDHAIEAIKNDESNEKEINESNHATERVKGTTGFNPEIHASNADGTPKFNKDGSLTKKRGRKSGSEKENRSRFENPNGNGGNSSSANTPQDQSAALASVTVHSVDAIMSGLIGQEMALTGEQKGAWVQSWHRYYASKNITDIPPFLEVAIVGASFYAPKFVTQPSENKPSPAARIKMKFKQWYVNRQARKMHPLERPKNVKKDDPKKPNGKPDPFAKEDVNSNGAKPLPVVMEQYEEFANNPFKSI